MTTQRATRLSGGLIVACGLLALAMGATRLPVPGEGPGSKGCWQIDLHTAGISEWQLLPGIGPVLAQRIQDWQSQGHNPARLDDLDTIQGIGPRTIDRIRPLVAGVDEATPGEFTITD
ncbi:MAG: helix-hairpin-helix domain-containing protein [Planctomycetota bacterium]|nr:helix-hairpin-helix domain-containing protein [Planctomycetota bacterium]